MFWFNNRIKLETNRLILRPPTFSDFRGWAQLRYESREFLKPWEPTWSEDHLTAKSFKNRVAWSRKSISLGTAIPLMLFKKNDGDLVGAITLDNIRRGPSQMGTLGYWTGKKYARQGYMKEAIRLMVGYAYSSIDLSRIESSCLPENRASISLLEKSGFNYEGVAQNYIKINGRWRTHMIYANLRYDRKMTEHTDN